MTEFDRKDGAPNLSMELSVDEFNAAILDIADNYSDELAYGLYAGCLDEDATGQAEPDVHFKHGLLYKFMAPIQQRRGDYGDALNSYRQALHEVEEGGFDEVWALELHTAEGHLLMHELDAPDEAIGSYEEAIRIFEEHFTGPDSEVAPDLVFRGYGNVISHLAAAYGRVGDYSKVRELNNRLAALGGISGAIFGFDDCEHAEAVQPQGEYKNKPIFEEIKEKLTAPVSLTDAEEQIAGLQSLEKLVDNEGFLPEAPEVREQMLPMIYGRYGILLPNLNERELYIQRALKLAKQNGLLVPLVALYVSLGENQAQRGRPMAEQHKSIKRAMSAAETAMDAGASAEVVRLEMIASLLMAQFQAKKDYIGIEKLKRRLNVRGMDLESTMPGAANPHLN